MRAEQWRAAEGGNYENSLMVVMACHAVTAMCNAEAAYCGHLRRVSRRQMMFTRLMMMVMMVMRAGVLSSTNTHL